MFFSLFLIIFTLFVTFYMMMKKNKTIWLFKKYNYCLALYRPVRVSKMNVMLLWAIGKILEL